MREMITKFFREVEILYFFFLCYNAAMLWEYDNTARQQLKKTDPKWYLERQILYGLDKGEKLDKKQLQKYLPTLNIPEDRRNFLELLCQD